MKILIVAMTNSIHTARWVKLISDLNWQIYVFPSDFLLIPHPDLKNVNIIGSKINRFLASKYKKQRAKKIKEENIELKNLKKPKIASPITFSGFLREFLNDNFYNFKVNKLIKVIRKVKPDIIHSLHIQEAAYLTLNARRRYKGIFPKWIVTNWGSDIHLFGNIKSQREKIIEVLKNCDYYSAECSRDIELAEKLGFQGKFLKVIPNSGGIDFSLISKIRSNVPASKRRNIMLKGYQGWSGRAVVGLRALERCADILKGYKIIIYSSNSVELPIAAELFTEKTGVETEIIPSDVPYEEILRYHGSSRISIGLSITDAISTSLLEAMVMGSFPIQSNTSCAKEWIRDGETAILVPPEDPEEVEKAIRIALTDDELVNKAAGINYKVIFDRIEYSKVKNMVIKQYEEIVR